MWGERCKCSTAVATRFPLGPLRRRIVELAAAKALFSRPLHPYTQALLSAAPIPDPAAERRRTRIVLKGEIPSEPPSGCRFRTRCWKATALCATVEPPLELRPSGRSVACHYAEE